MSARKVTDPRTVRGFQQLSAARGDQFGSKTFREVRAYKGMPVLGRPRSSALHGRSHRPPAVR